MSVSAIVKIFIGVFKLQMHDLLLDSLSTTSANNLMCPITTILSRYLTTIWLNLQIVVIITIFLALNCVKPKSALQPDDISFALIGNTYAESPFYITSGRVTLTFEEINKENPIFIVHLGDIFFGGKEWMGIKESDIARQFKEYSSIKIKPIVYNVKGDMDLLNDSPELYIRYTKRNRYYSFNYGNLHFVILDTADIEPGTVGEEQIKWLLKDLKEYKNSPAIFVFTHHPLLIPKYVRTAAIDDICKNPERLYSIFKQYPVKAVFSGHLPNYYIEKRDDILYVTSGCGGYNKSDLYLNINQYYIVRYSMGTLQINEKRIGPGR